MNRKELAIDYLRALSILALILVHLILPLSGMPPTEYSEVPVLFTLRDLLNLCVVTLVACSGFSLYLSTAEFELTGSSVLAFYRKRVRRLLLPWAHYAVISTVLYGVAALFFPGFSKWLPEAYPFLAVANHGGIPFAWILLKWIVILLLLLTLLFPFLRHAYRNQPWMIAVLVAAYLASSVLSIIYPADLSRYGEAAFSTVPILLMGSSFILGWSLVLIFGFSLQKLYIDERFMKKDMKAPFIAVLVFLAVHVSYRALGLPILIEANKFPPSPYYLSLGMAVTLVLLSFFLSFQSFFERFPRRTLEFFSANSYWIYLWSLVLLFISNYIFSGFRLPPPIKLVLEFLFNCVALSLIVIVQKRVGIRIYWENQRI
jgi:hypothetical protein